MWKIIWALTLILLSFSSFAQKVSADCSVFFEGDDFITTGNYKNSEYLPFARSNFNKIINILEENRMKPVSNEKDADFVISSHQISYMEGSPKYFLSELRIVDRNNNELYSDKDAFDVGRIRWVLETKARKEIRSKLKSVLEALNLCPWPSTQVPDHKN